MFCLAETKVTGMHARLLCLRYDQVFKIPPRGSRGGITMAWKLGAVFNVLMYCDHFVNLLVHSSIMAIVICVWSY